MSDESAMHETRRVILWCRGRQWAALAAILCANTSGCAALPGKGWADFKTARSIDEAADDESFPSAAEVGLASNEPK